MSESLKSIPDEYDPITDYHHLKFENRCLRGSGDDFQQLFEDVMVRARPGEFERVRPYGKFGDRKCDGLIESEGTIFQVYSPDELKQAEVQKKIDEDLEGAVQHWSDILEKWVFVYNAKRGTSSDIKLTLQQKQKQYPDIEIDSWSNDYLWEITRELSLQQRSEILGALPQWNVEKPKTAYIPNLPFHLLKRSTNLATLKDLLLSSSIQSTGITRSALKVGVYGMGGIGKSVLAAMLARDPEVRVAFPDGIFWITLGQEPILTLKQRDLAQILGDASLPFQDVPQGKIHLSQLLGDKTCLLILDDVWKADHLAAFNILGEQSGLLFTTQDSSIVKAFNASEHRVGLLSDDEALELLAACSGQCQETLPIEAHEIVKECGNLPLALSMIGAIAKARPNRWDNLLHKLQNADLDKIRHQFPDYPYPDLLKAIQVSVDALDPEVKVRYLDFAVFPEDTAIPETTLRTFWEPEGLDEYDTQDVIDALVERSLARRDENGNLSLHDLQYDYVKKQASDLPVLHNKLLAAYKIYCPQGWHTYSNNDTYFFEHLAYHLKKAKRTEELYSLLTASPSWMEAKFVACEGDAAYIADLELALAELSRPLTSFQIVTLIQLHAAKQTVYQRVLRYSNTDLATLVWLGRKKEALSYARLQSEPLDRFDSLVAIFKSLLDNNQLDRSLLDEAWETLDAVYDDEELSIRYSKLATVLANAGYVAEANQAFAKVEEIELWHKDNGNWLKSITLSHLAMSLAKAQRFQQAMEVLQRIEKMDNFDLWTVQCEEWGEICNEFALAFAKAGEMGISAFFLNKALDTAEERGDYALWTNTRINWVETLAQSDQFDEAEETALSGKSEDSDLFQALALSKLALALSQAGLVQKAETIFTQVLKLLSEIDRDDRIYAAEQIALTLARAGLCKEATENLELSQLLLDTTENNIYFLIQERKLLAIDLISVGYHQVADSILIRLEQIIEGVEDQKEKIRYLIELALALAQTGFRDEAIQFFLKVEKTIDDLEIHSDKFVSLETLASALTRSKLKEHSLCIWKKAEETLDQFDYDDDQILTVLENLFQLLYELNHKKETNKILGGIIDYIHSIQDTWQQSLKFEKLAKLLAKSRQFSRAKQIIKLIERSTGQAESLKVLSLVLAESEKFSEAEEVAKLIDDDYCRAEALKDLVLILLQSNYFDNAKELAFSIDQDHYHDIALCALVEFLTKAQRLVEAEGILDAIQDDFHWSEATINLTIALVQTGKVEEAVEIANAIESFLIQSEIFEKLASELEKSRNDKNKALADLLFDRAWESTQMIASVELKVKRLQSLAKTLGQLGDFPKALDVLGLQGLNQFLSVLVEWRESFESIQPDLAGTIVKEVFRIGSWTNSSWQEIYKLMQS